MGVIDSVGAATSISIAGPGALSVVASPPVASIEQPADIVSLSPAATAPVNIGPADPSKIDTLLATVGAASGFADACAHADWTDIDKGISTSKAKSERLGLLNAISIENTTSSLQASTFGVPLQSSKTDAPDGTSLISFTVNAFSFTDNRSAYTVTPCFDGTLSGTRDGKYWQSWQITEPNQSTKAALEAVTTVAIGFSASNFKLDISL